MNNGYSIFDQVFFERQNRKRQIDTVKETEKRGTLSENPYYEQTLRILINVALDEYPAVAQRLKTPTYDDLIPRRKILFGKERNDYKHIITAWDLGRDLGYVDWGNSDWIFIDTRGIIYDRYSNEIPRDEAVEKVLKYIQFCQGVMPFPDYKLPDNPGEELLAVQEFFARSLYAQKNVTHRFLAKDEKTN